MSFLPRQAPQTGRMKLLAAAARILNDKYARQRAALTGATQSKTMRVG